MSSSISAIRLASCRLEKWGALHLVEQALNRLKSGLVQAVDKLLVLLALEDKPNVQLRAAQTLLDQGIKAVELQDLAQRVEELERAISSQGGRPWR